MDNKQQAALDSFNRVASFNEKYASSVSVIDGYQVEENNLTKAIGKMTDGGNVQTGKDSPDEVAVEAAKTAMANTVHKFTLRGMVKADQLNNASLAHALDEPVTYMTKASKADAVFRATALRNVMNGNLSILTNITATDIADIDKSISAYSDMKEEPLENRKEKKAMGTDIIPQAEKNGHAAVENMYALLKSYLLESNPELVNLFALTIEETNTAVRHTTVGITTLAEESDEPIAGAEILDEKTEKKFETGDEGVAELGKHLNGDDTFVISAPGRQTVHVGFKIISRRENEFVIKLKKE